MSNGIDKNPLLDISKVYLEQIVEKKDDSYLEPDMKKRQANNEKARKEMAKVKGQKNPHFEEKQQGWDVVNSLSDAFKAMQEEEVEVDEAMSSYDRNRKRAAQRAADRNAARAAGKTGVVPGVGYVTPNKERETYTDEKGTTRHKSGAKMEGLDPVGKEDGDVNNDGKKDKTDKYLMNRRKAIGSAIKNKMSSMKKEETEAAEYIETVAKVKEAERQNDIKRWVQKESRSSNWRNDLSEVMTDDIDSKPIKEKNVKNKIKINPKLGEAIEEIGGTVVEMVEVDEEMTVTNADKKGNTPAYQAYKAGKKDKSGKPMYKAADHMKEGDGDPCWDSHKQVGMKKKGGKMVPNCVPKNEEVETEVEEGYKELSRGKRNTMFRKAGNLSRTALQGGDKGTEAGKKSGKIVKALNKDAEKYNRNDVKEESSMSPQEIALQKKKARIDRMIAQKRQQDLNKTKKSEAPTKAMGEEAECAHNMKGKECPVHGKKDCPSLEKIDERTRFAKETGKDFKTGNPSEKGGTRTGTSAFDKVSRQMRKTGGVMSSRGKGIQPQGKKKEKGAKGYKGVTPVDKIRNRLAQKRAVKPNPYRARAGESD